MNIISQIRGEVIELFPCSVDEKNKIYCTSDWIFPNNFEPMIDISKKLCDKYGGDREVCEIACLLHDSGLVYGRTCKDSVGHESKSLKFALKVLKKYDYDEDKMKLVLKCIGATQVNYVPILIEEKIVRTADILSQINSMHFFAKAHFYETWDMYLNFFEKKIFGGFEKICFDDEKSEFLPIFKHYKKIFLEYKKYN